MSDICIKVNVKSVLSITNTELKKKKKNVNWNKAEVKQKKMRNVALAPNWNTFKY